MKCYQSLHRALLDIAYFEAQLLSRLFQLIAIEPGDRAHKRDGQFRTVIEVDITEEELREAVDQEIMNLRDVSMSCTEWG